MSRIIPFALAGAGAAATSVGGVYLIKGTTAPTKGAEGSSGKGENPQALNATLNFTDLAGFKGAKGGSCSTRYFGSALNFNSKGTAIDSGENKIEDNHFNTSAQGESPAEGCLVINWERTNYPNNSSKWKGGFRWLWSFKKGTKGFVMFVATKPSTSPNTLDLDGGIYFVEQETGKTTWAIKKHKELTNASKKITKDDLDKTFPKAGTEIQKMVDLSTGAPSTEKSLWGFVGGKDEFGNLCKDLTSNGDCPENPTEPKNFKGAWMWKFSSDTKDNTRKLTDWSSNFDDWTGNLFGAEETKLNKILGSFTGSWSKSTATSGTP